MDTSGYVAGPLLKDESRSYCWTDLSPFQQGYVEAALAELQAQIDAHRYGLWMRVGFRHLSPAALAMILKDCTRWHRCYPQVENTQRKGASFWRCRTEQLVERPDFPPLDITLSDDGSIHLRERA